MKDLYSFHRDEKDLDKFYEIVKNAYIKIFEKCGLKTVYTLAAGGDFTTNYTHEFQVITPVGEDTIYVCEKCGYAENKEISQLEDEKNCKKCGGNIKKEKAIEVGNIFRYGTKYSEPFNLQFTDEDGHRKFVFTGAYGIGISRLMGTIVEVFHDEAGIIWPEEVAPFKYHLISIGNVSKEADSIYQDLQKAGIEVLYDDRDRSAGEKFADSDLIGIPYRLVLSDKTLAKKSVELKERKTGKISLVKLTQLKKL
jgi:prolyl-tRNA synthetase